MMLALYVFGPVFALGVFWYGLEALVDWMIQRRIDNNEVVAEPPY